MQLSDPSGLPRLLLVDDNLTLATLLAELLQSEYVVDIAPGGVAALRHLERFRTDIVITDVDMPDMSGWELVRCLKEQSLATSILVVTGGNTEAPSDLENTPVLPKPFSFPELQAAISRLIAEGRSEAGPRARPRP